MLKLTNINKSYDDKVIINDISLELSKGDFLFIVGHSGAGKTTLLHIIGGLEVYDKGNISINDVTVTTKELISNTSIIFQDFKLIDKFNVIDNLSITTSKSYDEIVKILDKLSIGHLKDKSINNISGGEKQRVAIARAILKDSEIILCDEPTGNLDSNNSISVIELLKEYFSDKVVIIVTHDDELAEEYATKVIDIDEGDFNYKSSNKDNLVINNNKINNTADKKTMSKFCFKSLFKNKILINSLFAIILSLSIGYYLVYNSAYMNIKIADNDYIEDNFSTNLVEFSKREATIDYLHSLVTKNEYIDDVGYMLPIATCYETEYQTFCNSTIYNNQYYIFESNLLPITSNLNELIVIGEIPVSSNEIALNKSSVYLSLLRKYNTTEEISKLSDSELLSEVNGIDIQIKLGNGHSEYLMSDYKVTGIIDDSNNINNVVGDNNSRNTLIDNDSNFNMKYGMNIYLPENNNISKIAFTESFLSGNIEGYFYFITNNYYELTNYFKDNYEYYNIISINTSYLSTYLEDNFITIEVDSLTYKILSYLFLGISTIIIVFVIIINTFINKKYNGLLFLVSGLVVLTYDVFIKIIYVFIFALSLSFISIYILSNQLYETTKNTRSYSPYMDYSNVSLISLLFYFPIMLLVSFILIKLSINPKRLISTLKK